jgi:hypothetical protein
VVVIFERRFRTAGLDDGHPLVRASVRFESLGLAHDGEGRGNGGEGNFFFGLWAFCLSLSSSDRVQNSIGTSDAAVRVSRKKDVAVLFCETLGIE